MKMPAISVIIPAYNEEKYIRQTLHSLKSQTFQDFEVIVVANGCTDRTEQIVRKRGITCYSIGTAQVSQARNYGASKATGLILLFLDADTTLEIDSLQKINSTFEGSVGTTKVLPDDNKFKFRFAMWTKNMYNGTGLYKGCSGALLCNREAFNEVGGYDSELHVKEHRALTVKLLKLGKYSFVNTPVTTSMRRYQKWSLSRVSLFWITQWVKGKFGTLKGSKYEEIR